MKNQLAGQIIGIPVSRQNDNPSCSNTSLALTHSKILSLSSILSHSFLLFISATVLQNFNGSPLANGLSLKFQGKLSLGARILQLGGVKRVFKQIFGVEEGEKLLKASQCYLSTTAGPLAGLLFISTQRVAFCSERSIKFFSPNGELVRFHYKVSPSRKRVLADLMDVLAWGKAIWKGLSHLASAGMAYKPLLTPQDKGERMPKGLHSR
ncbi:GEM-like protein 4 [Vitis vinifera]|uniref:GEM-like protein 4 n=1 Tax=Vitis vinifera TaxID=29760 RepID=A0A438JEC1_VITVI|nr:GEM-like protein 4 [Vitis vinifera]